MYVGFRYHSRSLEEEHAIALAAATWQDMAVVASENTNVAAAGEGGQTDEVGANTEALRLDIGTEDVLWYDDAAVTVVPIHSSVNRGKTTSGVKTFEIRTGGDFSLGEQRNLRVCVMDNDAPTWVPSGGVSACDGGWKEMSAAKGLEANSYSCHFSEGVATHMLRIFLRATLPTLRSAFGVTHCEHRDSVGLPRKAFTTLLSRCDCA